MQRVESRSAHEVPAQVQPAGFTATDLSLLLTTIVWGFNFVIAKAALAAISPMSFVGVRMTLAMAFMGGIYFLRGGTLRMPRRDLWTLIGLGLLGATTYQLLFIHGLDRTTAGNAALIQAALPVLVAAGSHALGYERLPRLAWMGVVLSILGIYLVVVGGPNRIAFDVDSLLGDLLIVGAVTSWAMYTVLSRPVLARHSPLRVTAVGMLGGVPPLVLIAIPSLAAEPWGSLPWAVWPAILYSGLLSIAIAYLLWNRGIQKVGSARTSVYTNLVPVVAVAASYFFLAEGLAWLQIAGALVIFAGILLTRLRR